MSGALPWRFFGVKRYAGMISGLPAPWPVGFLLRRGLLASSTLSTEATSPTLKYQRRSSIFFCVTSKFRSLPASRAVCAEAADASTMSSVIKPLRMCRMLHCRLQDIFREVCMRRIVLTMFVLVFAAGSALAVDLGKAEGTLVID